MADKPSEKAVVEKSVETEQIPASEQLSITNQAPVPGTTDMFSTRVTALSTQMLENGLMPATSQSEVPSTLGKAAELFDRKNIGIAADGGRSSGTAVSALLRASGAEVSPTMDIGRLHAQLEAAGWKTSEYKPGDKLNPGDLVFTGLERPGRNVGIVGENGKIYSHNMRTNHFEGRDSWSSKFVKVMRAPSDK